jgi:thiol:disulfide interchange protein
MRAIRLALLLSIAASMAGAGPLPESSALARAREEARRRGTIVMADFYTDWCGWCRRLNAVVYPDPAVRRETHRLVFIHVNAEKEGTGDARRYRVDGYPTIVFIAPDGSVVGRIVGFLPAPKFAERVREISRHHAPR